jgi:hypothetical protein
MWLGLISGWLVTIVTLIGLSAAILGLVSQSKAKYVVKIRGATRDSIALESEDREYIMKVINAVKEAINKRG